MAKTQDRTNMSVPERTNPSVLERTNMSDKLELKDIYIKPLTVSNYKNSKSNLKTLPDLNQPKEKIQYITEEILSKLGDKHSQKFYYLVASRVPEQVIRNALSEIKADGARDPAKVFTYRMKQYADKQQTSRSLTGAF